MWHQVKRKVVDHAGNWSRPPATLLPLKDSSRVYRVAPAKAQRKSSAYLKVLEKTDHFVAVAKPPHTICQDEEGESSVLQRMRQELPHLFPSNVQAPFHHPKGVHRLDKMVTGCLLFGTSAYGTQTLAKRFRDRFVIKGYLALLSKLQAQDSPLMTLNHGTVRDQDQQTTWTVLARLQRFVNGPITYLCWMSPLQGKKHQLRTAAAAHLKAPVLFEFDDVARQDMSQFRGQGYFRHTRADGIALHCASMSFRMGLDRHIVTCLPPDFGIWQQIKQEYDIDWQEVLDKGQLWRPDPDKMTPSIQRTREKMKEVSERRRTKHKLGQEQAAIEARALREKQNAARTRDMQLHLFENATETGPVND